MADGRGRISDCWGMLGIWLCGGEVVIGDQYRPVIRYVEMKGYSNAYQNGATGDFSRVDPRLFSFG